MERLGARVPQDVDMEDRLIYGLAPHRFGYLVALALAAFTVWSANLGSWPIRGALAACLVGLGAMAAWGRVSGRALDLWLADLARFLVANHRFDFRWVHEARLAFGRDRGPLRRIDVTATEAGAGLTTIGVELAAAVAMAGARIALVEVGAGAADPGLRLGLSRPGVDLATGLRLDSMAKPDQLDWLVRLLPPGFLGDAPEVVVITSSANLSVPHWALDRRVHLAVNRAPDRPYWPRLETHLIPDDPAFQLAEESKTSLVATRPGAGATRAINRLAAELLASRGIP